MMTDDQKERVNTAGLMAAHLVQDQGFAHVICEPGDATPYEFIVIDTTTSPDRYLLASTFGPAYPIPAHYHVDPGYAQSKYLCERYRNDYTGHLYAQFIAAFGKALT